MSITRMVPKMEKPRIIRFVRKKVAITYLLTTLLFLFLLLRSSSTYLDDSLPTVSNDMSWVLFLVSVVLVPVPVAKSTWILGLWDFVALPVFGDPSAIGDPGFMIGDL